VGPCPDSHRTRCRIRGLIRRYVRLKRLVWCCFLVKQVYGALISASTVRLNSTKEQLETLTPKGASGIFWARSSPRKNRDRRLHAFYVVTAYCDKCSVNHPTGVELNWPEQIPPNKSIAEVFDGTFLPPEIAMMSRNYFLCPQTGKINKQTDSTKTFLAKTK
jgi:hypothetical protein